MKYKHNGEIVLKETTEQHKRSKWNIAFTGIKAYKYDRTNVLYVQNALFCYFQSYNIFNTFVFTMVYLMLQVGKRTDQRGRHI